MFCIKCGKKLPEGSRFCSFCGQNLLEYQENNTTQNIISPDISNDNNSNDKSNRNYAERILSKEGLLSIKGRRNRKPFFLVNFVLLLISILVDKVFPIDMIFIPTVITICLLVLSSFNLAKRAQDMNINGYWGIGINVIAFIGGFIGGVIGNELFTLLTIPISLFFTFKRGTIGPNKYGPDPLG